MPWKPGQSGNPGGRTRDPRRAARKYVGRALRTLAYLCGDGDPAKTMIFPGVGTKPMERIAAAKELLARALDGTLAEIPDDELKREVARRAELERAQGGVAGQPTVPGAH